MFNRKDDDFDAVFLTDRSRRQIAAEALHAGSQGTLSHARLHQDAAVNGSLNCRKPQSAGYHGSGETYAICMNNYVCIYIYIHHIYCNRFPSGWKQEPQAVLDSKDTLNSGINTNSSVKIPPANSRNQSHSKLSKVITYLT